MNIRYTALNRQSRCVDIVHWAKAKILIPKIFDIRTRRCIQFMILKIIILAMLMSFSFRPKCKFDDIMRRSRKTMKLDPAQLNRFYYSLKNIYWTWMTQYRKQAHAFSIILYLFLFQVSRMDLDRCRMNLLHILFWCIQQQQSLSKPLKKKFLSVVCVPRIHINKLIKFG